MGWFVKMTRKDDKLKMTFKYQGWIINLLWRGAVDASREVSNLPAVQRNLLLNVFD